MEGNKQTDRHTHTHTHTHDTWWGTYCERFGERVHGSTRVIVNPNAVKSESRRISSNERKPLLAVQRENKKEN